MLFDPVDLHEGSDPIHFEMAKVHLAIQTNRKLDKLESTINRSMIIIAVMLGLIVYYLRQ